MIKKKSEKFIKSRAHIANCLRLLSLPKDVINLIEMGKISRFRKYAKKSLLVGLENKKPKKFKLISKIEPKRTRKYIDK